MAGHRRVPGKPPKPTRAAAREERMKQRVARAATPESRADAAFGALRMAAAHADPDAAARALEDATARLLELTRWLTTEGDRR